MMVSSTLTLPTNASIAQLAEQHLRNVQVVESWSARGSKMDACNGSSGEWQDLPSARLQKNIGSNPIASTKGVRKNVVRNALK